MTLKLAVDPSNSFNYLVLNNSYADFVVTHKLQVDFSNIKPLRVNTMQTIERYMSDDLGNTKPSSLFSTLKAIFYVAVNAQIGPFNVLIGDEKTIDYYEEAHSSCRMLATIDSFESLYYVNILHAKTGASKSDIEAAYKTVVNDIKNIETRYYHNDCPPLPAIIPVYIIDLLGLYILIGIGIVLSFLIVIGEIIYNRLKLSWERNRMKNIRYYKFGKSYCAKVVGVESNDEEKALIIEIIDSVKTLEDIRNRKEELEKKSGIRKERVEKCGILSLTGKALISGEIDLARIGPVLALVRYMGTFPDGCNYFLFIRTLLDDTNDMGR